MLSLLAHALIAVIPVRLSSTHQRANQRALLMETRCESVMFGCILPEKVLARLVTASARESLRLGTVSVRTFGTLRVLCSSAVGISPREANSHTLLPFVYLSVSNTLPIAPLKRS